MKKINTRHNFNAALIGIILFNGKMINENVLYIIHNEKRLDYADEKVEYISNYIYPKSITTYVDKKGKYNKKIYYKTSELKYLYKKIYINGKKRITKKIINRFNEITLAIMYMDNGYLSLRRDKKNPNIYKSRHIYINMNNFSLQEVKMLQNQIRLNWNIDFKITIDKGKIKLYCNTKNTIKFINLIKSIVEEFSSMKEKIDLKYN